MTEIKERIEENDPLTIKTILLVEDEPIIAMNQKLILEKFGYKVITARDADRAFNTLSNPSAVQLVLMDINLGEGMDGTEAARRILEKWDLPVVFLSSHSEPEIINRIQTITSYGYVMKNSGYSILQNSIQMAFKLFDAKKKLQDSENRYKSILANIKDVLLVLNKDLSIRYTNSNFEKYFGWKEKEILNSIFTLRLDPIDQAFFELTIKEISVREGLYKTIEVGMKDSSSTHRVVNLTITNAMSTVGINGILVAFHDLSEVKKNETHLTRIESLLKTTQRLTKVGGWEVDLKTNKIFWTEESYRIHDLPLDISFESSEEWIQKSITFFKPSDQVILNQAFAECIKSGIPYDLELEFVSYKGVTKWIRTVSEPILVHGKVEKVLGFIMDITETKNAQLALQNKNEEFATLNEELSVTIEELEAANNDLIKSNEEVFELGQIVSKEKIFTDAILENSPGLLAVFNANGELIQWNKQLEITLDLSSRNLLELSVSEFINFGNGKNWLDFIHQFKSKKTIETNYHLRLKDDKFLSIQSNWVAYEMNGYIFYMTLGFDKTAQFLTEKKLEESNFRFKRVFQNAPFPMIIHTDDGVIEHVNLAWKELTGYKEEQLKTVNDWTRLAYGTEQETVKEVIDELYQLEGKKKDGEFTIRTSSGKELVWDFSSAYLGRLEDNRKAILSIANDITERKIHESRIQSLLEEKELILKEVHHRIKNNMNTIHSLLSLQMSKINDSKERDALQDAANRVQSMMLLYERLYKDSNFNTISIQSYLPNLVDQILLNFPNAFSVKVVKDIDDIVLSVTKLQSLGIIVYEILSNCMKYAFDGISSCEISFSAKLSDKYFILEVKDNGIGFPEGMNHTNSTGFGLMLINGLATQLGGELTISNINGTQVRLLIELSHLY
ncbi:MAG: PAS domain S-box protein [Leptospiraceae bacterium]|nr:PAS domain S-box protein [Leptospiraceae bacterium]